MSDRERLAYTGDHDLYLPGSIAPRPDLARPPHTDPDTGEDVPATVVEVAAAAAPLLSARGDFTLLAGKDDPGEAPLAVDEPIPLDVQRQREADAPTHDVIPDGDGSAAPAPPASATLAQLTGDDLDDALADAGLSRVGSDEDRRERLRVYYSARASQVGTTTEALSLDALRAAQAELDAHRASTTMGA